MEWPDASNFASLLSGYYKLFVDPKRTIYFRNVGQTQLVKPGKSYDQINILKIKHDSNKQESLTLFNS